ncbi:hypothetical protein [Maribellus sediminis]|uniref:hypothetical protein n=1 Tax=Maribellus sediminis TaxID=2696285 RepID=UPI00197F1CCB|nr:hypothetical protein [Maribellus sediminis]
MPFGFNDDLTAGQLCTPTEWSVLIFLIPLFVIILMKTMVMNIQAEKLSLIEWISTLKDTSVIDKLLKLRDDYTSTNDWWNELKQEELDSIERGLKDFEEGQTQSDQTARQLYEKYL